MHDTIRDLLAGTSGGMAQVLSGQPFDYVKVRLQSSNAYNGPMDVVRKTLAAEGPSAFYKGTVAPLIGIGACVSLQFAFLNAIQREMRKGKTHELSPGQLYLSGAGGGLGNSILVGPVEHIRIRLQSQSATSGSQQYSGPIDAVKKIFRSDGFRGIYKGQVATLLREFHGMGMYFLTYEGLVQRHCQQAGYSRKNLSTANVMTYGIAAGWVLWLTAYPLDIIKSRMQTDGFASNPASQKFKGTWDCTRQLYKSQGLAGFTKGLTPTLIRSPIANAATFVTYETVLKALSD